MRKSLVFAAVALALDILAPVVGAQAYVVNGQAAARAEVQYLVSYDSQPAREILDLSAVTNQPVTRPTSMDGDQGCWFDTDVPHCE
jgi:hypothetical protein